jgi:hypothetical protein
LLERTVLVGIGAFEHGQAVRRDFLEHDSAVAVRVKALHHPLDARAVARAVPLPCPPPCAAMAGTAVDAIMAAAIAASNVFFI